VPAFARGFLARYGQVSDVRASPALALARELRVPECVGIYTAVSPVTRCGPFECRNA